MRGFLYSLEAPEGKLFEDGDYEAKAALGWVDTPALLDKNEPAGVQPPEEAPRQRKAKHGDG